MKSPFWSEDKANVPPATVVAAEDHQPSGCGQNVFSFWSENIDPFVNARCTPGLVPEGRVVPVRGRSALHWNHQALRHQVACEKNHQYCDADTFSQTSLSFSHDRHRT